jgi:hypothetical protein
MISGVFVSSGIFVEKIYSKKSPFEYGEINGYPSLIFFS